jgi:regulator of nucleoside diphosphate kinase
MDPAEIPVDVVTMGSRVCLRELESGDLWTFTLCYPADMDIEKNRISVLSPVGTAIIGQRVGDIVDWPTPLGSVRIQIEELFDQPEMRGIGDSSDLVIWLS